MTLVKLRYDPDELIDAYIEELRRVYGDEIAEKSNVTRNRSWYYLSVAYLTNGGVKVDPFPKSMRRYEFEAALEELRFDYGEKRSC